MDELDANLIAAWERVRVRLLDDPAELRRRIARMTQGTFSRPRRACCVALRASDTRIDPPVDLASTAGADGHGAAHEVRLDAAALRALCAPVKIDWPGVPLTEAARRLGWNREALRYWLPARPGRTRDARAANPVRRFEEIRRAGCPLVVRYEPRPGRAHRGYEVPMVWTSGWLDPAGRRGVSPGAVWGSMWLSFAERIGAGWSVTAQRVPRIRPYGSGWRRRGWDWVCPGLGESRPCGRRTPTLFAPIGVMSVAEWMEDQAITAALREAGGAERLRWPKRFACARCWRMARTTMAHRGGWNDLVGCLSGGLLYGREVAKPAEFARRETRLR